ncbi:YicC family protein [Brevibacillus antibioticus]|uniref:YicC family protein n=1 Tax=Brevibacillus antibioticus TaxID=2570228 RepID=A0A4U2Y425_9BACL|nr:YicC/YloC family endoribonuclease [Brevibacillus antibioticus]TKI54775.1 YicC family protein [Brevibacillus antibioticus]
MIRSMTGYGRKEDSKGSIRATVEIRAVNHRFSEIVVRLPKAWNMLEDSTRKLVAQYVRRGRVDVTVSVEGKNSSATVMGIDWDVAEQLVSISREMTQRFSLETPLTVKDLLHFPGVIHTKESEDNVEELAEWLQDLVRGAAFDLVSMKETEGKLLHADLASRLTAINTWTREISQLAPLCREDYKGRLEQRVSEWAGLTPFELDPARVAQEVAFFADKSDISEELTRLDSHCQQFANQLGKDEAIGRKLDFLLQEMNREANTIASKANHLRIQHLAVEIKTELEKMREQIQNVE